MVVYAVVAMTAGQDAQLLGVYPTKEEADIRFNSEIKTGNWWFVYDVQECLIEGGARD